MEVEVLMIYLMHRECYSSIIQKFNCQKFEAYSFKLSIPLVTEFVSILVASIPLTS